MRTFWTGSIASAGLLVLVASPARSGGVAPLAFEIETVVLSGDSAPGTTGGELFSAFRAPRIAADGSVGFLATLDDASQGIWAPDGAGGLELVARVGSPAPGTALAFTGLTDPRLDAGGEVAFSGFANGLGGVWGPEGGGLGLLAFEYQPAPGLPSGVNYVNFHDCGPEVDQNCGFPRPSLSDGGEVAFHGLLGSSIQPTDEAIFRSDGAGNVVLVAHRGDAAPGTATTYAGLDEQPMIDSLGRVGFGAILTDIPVGGAFNALLLPSSTSVAPFALVGDPAPGTATTFRDLFLRDMDDQGRAAFSAELLSSGIDGVFGPIGSDPLALIALEGAHAPGTPTGVVFTLFFGNPIINDGGRVVFAGNLDQSVGGVDAANDRGLWVSDDAGVRLVAREGDPAPGSGGMTFKYVGNAADVNEEGRIALQATLQDDLGTPGSGIFLYDDIQGLSPVVVTGSALEVAPGDFRVVSGLLLEGDSIGDSTTSLNDAGQVAFRASFDDGSTGIFVATPVPEPPLALMLVTALPVVARLGRRIRRS